MRRIISVVLVITMVFSLHCVALAESAKPITDEQIDLLIDLIGYQNTAYEIENKLLADGYEYHAFYQIGILSKSVGKDTGFVSYQAIDKKNSVLYVSDTFSTADEPVKEVTIQIKYSASNWKKVTQLLGNMFGDPSEQQVHDEEKGTYTTVVWQNTDTTISVDGTRSLPNTKSVLIPKANDQVFEIIVTNPSNIAGDKELSLQRSFSIKGGIQFGMSQEDVIEIMGVPLEQMGESLYYETTVANLDCAMIFHFESNYLFYLGYSFIEEHSSDNLYINDYDKIDHMLQEKYGVQEPEEEWTDTLYKDSENDHGFAVSKGDLSITNKWYTLDATIHHAIYGDNYKITHLLLYIDPWYNSSSTNSNSNDDI